VDGKGHFTLSGVPAGTYTLSVWNTHLKSPDKSVTIAAGQTVTEKLSLKR
jgi:hypothetical protein